MIEIGSKVRDVVTQFEGVVIGRTKWLTGCDTCGVQATGCDEKGAPKPAVWFDDLRLEVLAPPAFTWPDGPPPLAAGG